ncbi:hypothetical protein VARIO8X_130187 [Burkholderiales bacterium 8X]|nr:hypothetical protein VARIO8X_130187 [Burkholderiales bacterium 8X]
MIWLRFDAHPEFVWITLLICRPDTLRSLANQGSERNAHKKSKVLNPMKSTT